MKHKICNNIRLNAAFTNNQLTHTKKHYVQRKEPPSIQYSFPLHLFNLHMHTYIRGDYYSDEGR